MANVNAKRDDNWQPVVQGETNDALRETRSMLIDPITGRLLVTGTVTGLTGTELNTDPFYHVNNWEVSGDITYVGEESNDSQWRVTELTKSTGVVHYATIFNNPTVLTYVTAWADRALLVYGDFATS
jgi:hypothetical protein